jgi:hypothetical protein
MRCRYCGKILPTRDTASTSAKLRNCSRCTRLKTLHFVAVQGDGVSGFREVMIWQHANEPNRKLVETRSWHFTVFVDAHEQICGFEVADADESHLLKWRRGEPPVAYAVENIGKGYHNRHELTVEGKFAVADAISELNRVGANIRPQVYTILLEGLSAYEKSAQPRG